MDTVTVVKGRFRNNNSREFDSKEYSFFCDIEVAVGDIVVADTVYGVQLLKISSKHISVVDAAQANRYIVQKVDTSALEARILKAQKLAELRARMELRKAEMEELEAFKKLAAIDEVSKKLLEEFEELSK